MLIKWQELLLVSCRAYLSLDKLTSLSGYGLSFSSVSCQNKEPYNNTGAILGGKRMEALHKKSKSCPLKLGVRKLA